MVDVPEGRGLDSVICCLEEDERIVSVWPKNFSGRVITVSCSQYSYSKTTFDSGLQALIEVVEVVDHHHQQAPSRQAPSSHGYVDTVPEQGRTSAGEGQTFDAVCPTCHR